MAPLSTKREHAEYNIRSHCHFSVLHLKSVCKAQLLGLNPFVAFTPAEASAYDVRCVHMNYKKMREGCSPFPIVFVWVHLIGWKSPMGQHIFCFRTNRDSPPLVNQLVTTTCIHSLTAKKWRCLHVFTPVWVNHQVAIKCLMFGVTTRLKSHNIKKEKMNVSEKRF